MSRRRATGLVVAGLTGSMTLMGAPPASSAVATVHSTSFEAGTDGWYGRGGATLATTTAQARTGLQSLAVTGRTQAWEGPGLDTRTLMPAGTYTVQAWVRLAPGSGTDTVTATVARKASGAPSTSYERVASVTTVSDSTWTLIDGTYEHGTSNDQLELYLESPDPTQSFFVDDVRIAGEAAAPTAPSTRSDIRTDFESGLQGWGPRGSAQVTTTTSDRRGGDASLLASNRLQSWQGPAVDVTRGLAVGETVAVSVWAKLAPGEAPASLKVSVQRNRGTSVNYDNVAGAAGVLTADAWTQLTGTYTLGAPIDTAQLYVEGDANVDFMIDDFALTSAVETPIQDIPGLKDVLGGAGIERVGVAIDQRETVGRPSQLLLKHFDAFTPENDGKPAEVQPTEGTFTFGDLDRLLDYADANGVQVYGHVLVWHSQTPEWFFKDGARDLTDSPADQALLKSRMDAHIKAVADHVNARYPNGDSPIWAWDVVNEVIADGDTPNPHDMRNSRWFDVLGEGFVDEAFRLADKHFPDAKLFINDYNTEMPSKRADYLSLIAALKARGVQVDGVGHQAHVDFARPVQWLDDSLTAVEKLDPTLLQVITELDVSDSKENNGADVSAGTVPQHSPAMAAGDAETEVGYYYRDLFSMLRGHSGSLESVTFWGISNARSWLRTWPAARPWEAPLPFDDDLQAAPAYWGIVDPTRLAARPADVLPPRIAAQDAVRVVATDRAGAVVRYAVPSAIDTQAGRLAPDCTPAPGSRFPVGRTVVECTVADPRGNQARPATFDVVVAAPVADLRAVVTGPSQVRAGSRTTYTLTVTNAGPSASEELTAVVSTAGLTKPQATGSTGTGTVTVAGTTVTGHRWTVPALASGSSVTFSVSGLVTSKVGSTVSARAATTSVTSDPASANNLTPTFVTTVTR